MIVKEKFYTFFPCLAGKKEKPSKPPPQSIDWQRVAKIALIGAGAIAIGVTAYHLYHDLPTLHDLPSFDNSNRALIKALEPVCKDAVQNYCKTGPTGEKACLRDYLVKNWFDKNWSPDVSIEEGHHILCPVDVQSAKCSALVGQISIEQWLDGKPPPFVFEQNYEHIIRKIPDYLPMPFRSAINHFQGPKNGHIGLEKGYIGFKSHVFCRPLSRL